MGDEVKEENLEEEDMEFEIGAAVYVDHKLRGEVRYIGPVEGLEGQVIGLELEELPPEEEGFESEQGRDGTKGGVEYFKVEAGHGMLVQSHRVVLQSAADGAASRVQSMTRRLHDSKLATKERNAATWNKLDNMNESLAIKRSLQMKSLFEADYKHAPRTPDIEVEVEDDYDGPVLTFPLDRDQVLAMMEAFKTDKELHVSFASELVTAAAEICSKEATVQRYEMEGDAKLTVVGDIHGQLQDLYSIFTINGLPGPTSAYLFNGDFVDRGENSAEVLFTLLALKVLYPTTVLLNRGNHECRQQNRLMGFEEEMLEKYEGPQGRLLLTKCHEFFDALPLCALVQDKIFVVHGGLFHNDGVSLDHIEGINRRREPPIHSRSFEDQLFEAMLWSDPRPIQGRQLSSRGAGVEFGQDVTHEFLRSNHAALIIRSHECVREGFEMLHAGRLITLFSASRYCGLQNNKGAFMNIGADLQPEIQQFYAHSVTETHWDTPEQQLEQDEKLEEDAVKMIIEQIIDNKPSLYWHFTRQDKDKTGKCSRLQWAKSLKLILQLDLPYLSFLDKLVDTEEDGSINYTHFLERYRVQVGGLGSGEWQDNVIDCICEKIYVAVGAGNMDAAFKAFDVDGDGKIEYGEFVRTLQLLDIGLSDTQIFELMRGLDKDNDSLIDVDEFASRFELVFDKIGSANASRGLADTPSSRASLEMSVAMRGLVNAVLRHWNTADNAFAQLLKMAVEAAEEGGGGAGLSVLSYEDFVAGLTPVAAGIDADTLRQIAKYMDTDGDGKVSKGEFCNGMKVLDRKGSVGRQSVTVTAGDALNAVATAAGGEEQREGVGGGGGGGDAEGDKVGWQEGVIQSIANFMYQNRQHIASTFRSFDVNNDGVVSREEFSKGLKSMSAVFDGVVTEDQIDAMMSALDGDGDGKLSYDEFLSGFQIVDTKTGNVKTGGGKGHGVGSSASAGAARRASKAVRPSPPSEENKYRLTANALPC